MKKVAMTIVKAQDVITKVCLCLCLVILPTASFGQDSAVLMTLKTKRYSAVVTINRGQLAELAKQPGISLMKRPKIASATQMAIPVPSSLGGGFIIGGPEALAAGMNATGLTTRATVEGVLGATVAEGAITKGATVAARKVATGVKTGTVVLEVVIAAGIVGGIVAAAGGSSTSNH